MTLLIALPLLGASWQDYISGMFILLLIVGSTVASKIGEYLKKRREEEARRARDSSAASAPAPAGRAVGRAKESVEQPPQTTKKALREILEEVLGVPSSEESEDALPIPLPPPVPSRESLRKESIQVVEAKSAATKAIALSQELSQRHSRRSIFAGVERFSEIQKAVIFAEILGKPVAMRDE